MKPNILKKQSTLSDFETLALNGGNIVKSADARGTKSALSIDRKIDRKPWYLGTLYTCKICEHQFLHGDSITKHLRETHTGKQSSEIRKAILVSKSYHNCMVCKTKVIGNRKAIGNHIRKHNMTLLTYEETFNLNSRPPRNVPSPKKEDKLKLKRTKGHVALSTEIEEVIMIDDDMDDDEIALWKMANGRWRLRDIGEQSCGTNEKITSKFVKIKDVAQRYDPIMSLCSICNVLNGLCSHTSLQKGL